MKTLEETMVISPEDKDLLLRVKSAVQQSAPGATVLLYGSVARGTQETESDYDIFVLTDRVLTEQEQDTTRNAIFELELGTEKVISAKFCSRSRWEHHPNMPFHVEVARDGIIL